MKLFDLLTSLASQARNKTPSPAPTPGSEPRDWRSTLRGTVDALIGKTAAEPAQPPFTPPAATQSAPSGSVGLTPSPPDHQAADRAAVARYEYLLRTAEPVQLERIHADAFARLTPAERDQLHARLRTELPLGEQPRTSQPADLARTATRAEAAQPGFLAGILARIPRPGAATTGQRVGVAAASAGGGLLIAVAGGAAVSAIAAPLLAEAVNVGIDFDALAGLVSVEGFTSGLEDLTPGATDLADGVSGVAAGASEQVGGLGEDITGFGEQLSNLEIPGWGRLFGG